MAAEKLSDGSGSLPIYTLDCDSMTRVATLPVLACTTSIVDYSTVSDGRPWSWMGEE